MQILLASKYPTKQDEVRLFERYDKAIEELFDLLKKYSSQIPQKYLDKNLYKQVLEELNAYKLSFENEQIYYCHDDFMPNNFMLDKNNKIWTIDVENSSYDFFAKKLRGYIQHMLHKQEKNKIITFFRGFISGFFGNQIPQNLSKQMSYIYLADMLEICRDPLKKGNIKTFFERCELLISAKQKGEILSQCDALINS